MRTKEELEVVVREVVADVSTFPIDDVKLESELIADLDLDSLDTVEVAMKIEEQLDIAIDDLDVEDFTTVEIILKVVCKILNVKYD